MTLDESRAEIDKIDAELLKLFEKRLSVCEDIAREKMKNGLPILNAGREKAVLEKAKSAVSPDYAQYAEFLTSYIMELSRSRQREIMETARGAEASKSEIVRSCGEVQNPRVAVGALPGSYAAIAAAKMYEGCELVYLGSFEEVVCCLEDGSADYGVLPVENSTAGSVIDVYDLLLKYKCNIVKALPIRVNHCLLGVRGAALSDIREVYSHPHAFPQCSDFFNRRRRIKKSPCSSTASAAEAVAKTGDPSKAAIASAECAHIYGLDILAESIQDADNNCTRFISVSKRAEIHDSANKISLIIKLPHVTGSLYRALSRFALCGLNLTKIESRPDPKTPFEYYFYVDFLGSLSSQKTVDMLRALKEELPFFYFLGCYNEN